MNINSMKNSTVQFSRVKKQTSLLCCYLRLNFLFQLLFILQNRQNKCCLKQSSRQHQNLSLYQNLQQLRIKFYNIQTDKQALFKRKSALSKPHLSLPEGIQYPPESDTLSLNGISLNRSGCLPASSQLGQSCPNTPFCAIWLNLFPQYDLLPNLFSYIILSSILMSRKVKSTKYTHFSTLHSKKTFSFHHLTYSERQIDSNTAVILLLEDILQNVQQITLGQQHIQQQAFSILASFQQCSREYFYFQSYSSQMLQAATCEAEPAPIIAPEADLSKKHIAKQKLKTHSHRISKQKMESCYLEDFHKAVQKCKKERDLQRQCSNDSLLPLLVSSQVSEDNNEQILQLLRMKKELFLQGRKNSWDRLKTKAISTQRKDRKYYFQNDSGQAFEMTPCEPLAQVKRLIHVNVKVQQGQAIAPILKKKAIMEFSCASKKSRRRVDRNLGDTCVLIEQIKENDVSLESAINRLHNDMKAVRLKTEDQWIPSALKLPILR